MGCLMAAEDYIDIYDPPDDYYEGYERRHKYWVSGKTKMTNNKINKFYVAADKISSAISGGFNDNWTKATEAEAIKHAQQLMEENPSRKSIAIVKIVALVEKPRQPIKVRRIK